MDCLAHDKLIKLFPKDIINIILLYSDNKIIIQLQNYFPNLLKHIMITGKELKLINKNNYVLIRNLDCYKYETITEPSSRLA